jgi:hypothetical protein
MRTGSALYSLAVVDGENPVDITPLTQNPSGEFVGDVTGIDLTSKLTADQVAAIEAGMVRFALVFHGYSDASCRATGAGYSLLSARVVPGYAGNTEFGLTAEQVPAVVAE